MSIDLMKSVEFMENNLKEKINIDDIAKHIGYSSYHYIRLFQLATDDTPWNYLRKRRLTEAAKELKKKGGKIIRIAMDYQFNSSEAFSRAFSQYFNISPTDCRKSSDHIQLFYKKKLTSKDFKKERKMYLTPEIRMIDEKKIMGIVYYGKNENEEIPLMWQRHISKINQLDNLVEPTVTYGFCFHTEDYKDMGCFHYLISKEVKDFNTIPMNFVAKTIPKSEYAIFTHEGDVSLLGDTYQYIFGEWLPKQDFTTIEHYNMERYSHDGIQLLIPIKR